MPGRVVAAFDFDGTLSTRDNVLPFLATVAGRAAVAASLARALPDLTRGRRDAVKARLARDLLSGRDERETLALAERFAADCRAEHLRADVLERATWHRDEGHERVIVSASFECYLGPIASALGFDAALGTRLESAAGRLTGALDGPNVRRAEKVRRLDAWLGLGAGDAEIWAYGNSAGDRELFARAAHPVRVGRSRISPEPPRPS
ncbi:MAG TPA: HAD-IB family hydrolase [Acidimicrobiia bacterium]